MMARCRSCRAEVVFARHHKTGKRQPLEVDPEGAFVLAEHGEYVPYDPLFRPKHRDRDRYTSHFATCPEADGWRS